MVATRPAEIFRIGQLFARRPSLRRFSARIFFFNFPFIHCLTRASVGRPSPLSLARRLSMAAATLRPLGQNEFHMANKMLIDASHPEETRVVVLRGNRVEEFDFESASKKQLRGNIYLAKVTRVEPSLQAAFVDYGGNRHGFLAFSEIHPDYYQIPVVDRQALIDEDARAQRDEEEEKSRAQRRSRRFRRGDRNGRRAEKRRGEDATLSEPSAEPFEEEAAVKAEADFGAPAGEEAQFSLPDAVADAGPAQDSASPPDEFTARSDEPKAGGAEAESQNEDASGFAAAPFASFVEDERGESAFASEAFAGEDSRSEPDGTPPETGPRQEGLAARDDEAERSEGQNESPTRDRRGDAESEDEGDGEDEEEHVEQLGGDAMEEVPFRPQRYRKQYKIQEVIKRRQVLLVQVVKEERGNKGAALTTYLSLAGRYSVLMPNTARGGGISRKITDSTDRQRLKSIAQELEVPEGMGVILRTAGAARSKAEVKRDFEYLLRMWETVRETTLRSTAPMLVYEEGSLIKRAIRDLYNKEIDEIVVAGDNGYREAKEFMRLLMPSHAKSVQPYRDPQPLFAKSGVETQLDAMFSNQVTLKSGGYIVINQTEALVAIDVNSGRSTREHNIEDTALRTNLEACDEIARQLRLRDLAGLIVLDLIDMEENRNNRAVERRLKDALKNDRARIQVGRISHFGLLEMSRQRIRTGVLEGSTIVCPHCVGAGTVRSTSSIALYILRVLEDALIKSASYDLIIKTRTEVALYILNQKRAHLRELEKRFGVSVTIGADDSLTGSTYYALERGELAVGGGEVIAFPRGEAPPAAAQAPADIFFVEAEDQAEPESAAEEDSYAAGAGTTEDAVERREGESESEANSEGRRKRRRRRRRGRGGDREGSGIAANAPQPPDDALEAIARIGGLPASPPPEHEIAIEAADDLAGAEPIAPAPDERQRPRRGGRRPREVEPAFGFAPDSEAAQEVAAASELRPETSPVGAEVEAESEAPPQKPARRGRRAPRAPRGAIRAEAAEAPAFGQGADETASSVQDGPHQAPEPEPQLFGDAPVARAETDAQETATQETSATAEAQAGAPVKTKAPSLAAGPTQPDASSQEPLQPAERDSSRPKRSGWWQRAKASFRG